MKQGIRTIEKLYDELDRQREARTDLIANTKNLMVNSTRGTSLISVATDNDVLSYAVSEVAHRQIAERLNIPYKYYERMRLDYPELLDQNING